MISRSPTPGRRIAVVMPVYNRAHLITESLDSVARQLRVPDETIIVDDGSTDGTASVVEEWCKTHGLAVTLLRQENSGVSAARNAGINSANADLIALLDSDDVWLPHHLLVLEKAFHCHPRLAICAANSDRLDSLPDYKRMSFDESLFERIQFDEGYEELRLVRGSAYESFLPGAYVATCGQMFPRKTALSAGLFDESLTSWEDQDFLLRMSRLGQLGLYVQCTSRVRKHDSNLSGRKLIAEHIRCAIAVLEKMIRRADELELSDAELLATRQYLALRLQESVGRASRYGMKPYWAVCRQLASMGYIRPLLQLKPFLRAVAFPAGPGKQPQLRTAGAVR